MAWRGRARSGNVRVGVAGRAVTGFVWSGEYRLAWHSRRGQHGKDTGNAEHSRDRHSVA